jgi:hypothetical protein
LGVIDSLSAGYRLLWRRWELLLVPILLDVLLWLGPRLSVAPLFARLADFYRMAGEMQELPADIAVLNERAAELLALSGEQSNLLTSLANGSLFHVPSLLATLGPVSGGMILEIGSAWTALGLFLLFGALGMLIGVAYLNLLAIKLPLGTAPKAQSVTQFLQRVIRHWLWAMLFVVLAAILVAVGTIPATLGVTLLTLLSPALGQVLMFLFMGGLFILFFYLYFVTAALVVDNLPLYGAVVRSYQVVRHNFWATLGLVLLTNLITAGIALLFRGLTDLAPIGVLAAIVIYAYIGSGLAMALLVFYRTRVLRGTGEPPVELQKSL